MKTILRRKSVIAFFIVVFLGIFAPVFASHSPYAITGAPFARPVWWKTGTLSSSQQFSITNAICKFSWNRTPPAVFSLKGSVNAGKNEKIKLIWHTPDREYILAELHGNENYWINIDGRDMLFKQYLSIPPISRTTEYLFNKKKVADSHDLQKPANRFAGHAEGNYFLEIAGNAQNIDLTLSLSGERQGLLGTDQRGRDVWSRLLYGIRTSITIGITATIIASFLGMFFGLTAGYFGGFCDSAIMRAVDILLSIPTLPILMTLAGLWGKGLWQLALILSIFSWMGTARSIRALVLTVRESMWVESLRALGASPQYILRKHIIRETAPILLANIALGVPGAILSEAGLAFLGLSDPRLISWGRMLHEAHSFGAFTEGAWWLLLPPGFGIVLVCLIFLDMGKFFEEYIDPRLNSK